MEAELDAGAAPDANEGSGLNSPFSAAATVKNMRSKHKCEDTPPQHMPELRHIDRALQAGVRQGRMGAVQDAAGGLECAVRVRSNVRSRREVSSARAVQQGLDVFQSGAESARPQRVATTGWLRAGVRGCRHHANGGGVPILLQARPGREWVVQLQS